MERAVRAWLVEVEAASSASGPGSGSEADEQIRAMRYLDAEVIPIRELPPPYGAGHLREIDERWLRL